MSEPINTRTVGTCGACGGPVVISLMYMSVYKLVLVCTQCGAHAQPGYGPVLPMSPVPRKVRPWHETTDWSVDQSVDDDP